MTYSEKLKSPKWQKKRLEILSRDGFTCKLCGDKESQLHVHHLEYNIFDDPAEIENEKLSTYCKYCHQFVSSFKKYEVLRAFSFGKDKDVKCFWTKYNEGGIFLIVFMIDEHDDLKWMITLRNQEVELFSNQFNLISEITNEKGHGL